MVKVKSLPEYVSPPYDEVLASSAVSAFMLTVLDDANAAAARTTLGLGSVAVENYTATTWTPTLTFGGGATGMTYTTQQGAYTRIGRLIQLQGRIVLSAKGSSTGSAVISGLPANFSNVTPLAVSRVLSMTGLTGALSAFGSVGDITFRQSAATGDAAVTDANFTNTTDIAFSCAYHTA